MKTNKQIVTIKSLFQTLLFKNIISILIIGIISFTATFFYNLKAKQIAYNYSITILPTNIWVSEKIIIEKKIISQYYTSFHIQKYFSELPSYVINKKFGTNEKGGTFINFKSIDLPIDVSNFLSQLNKQIKSAVLISLKNEYQTINRQFASQKNLNLGEVAEQLKDYPEVLKIQKLEAAINNQYKLDKKNMLLGVELAELGYFIKNFDEFFNSDMYFSLNGWKINDNNSTTRELFVSGFMFWLLFSSFFLFFKSKYFREKLSN